MHNEQTEKKSTTDQPRPNFQIEKHQVRKNRPILKRGESRAEFRKRAAAWRDECLAKPHWRLTVGLNPFHLTVHEARLLHLACKNVWYRDGQWGSMQLSIPAIAACLGFKGRSADQRARNVLRGCQNKGVLLMTRPPAGSRPGEYMPIVGGTDQAIPTQAQLAMLYGAGRVLPPAVPRGTTPEASPPETAAERKRERQKAAYFPRDAMEIAKATGRPLLDVMRERSQIESPTAPGVCGAALSGVSPKLPNLPEPQGMLASLPDLPDKRSGELRHIGNGAASAEDFTKALGLTAAPKTPPG